MFRLIETPDTFKYYSVTERIRTTMSTLNLNYFTAILLKNGKITVPAEIRELFSLKEGQRYIFQYVRQTLPDATEVQGE